jgi:hypothetical protein
MSDPPPKYDPTGMSAHPFDVIRGLRMRVTSTRSRSGPKKAPVDCMLFASSSLDKARRIFAEAIKHRLRIRLTIRQETQVLEQWPKPEESGS